MMCSVGPVDVAWRQHLQKIVDHGSVIAPRGQPTLEVLDAQVQIHLDRPVIVSSARKLNYHFMLAEALWVQAGDNRLAPLIKFVQRMAEYSDDGVTLAGAYGPPISAQLPYVIETLRRDRDTRQAALTTWKPSPPRSKDIPCTVAMTFMVRSGCLHQHVFMRSSDAWLGVPYDLFTFALVGLRIIAELNQLRRAEDLIRPGLLTLTAASAHLYLTDLDRVRALLDSPMPQQVTEVPAHLLWSLDGWSALISDLMNQRDGRPATFWEVIS